MTAEDRARQAARALRRTPVGDPPPIEHVRRRKTRQRLINLGIIAVILGGTAAWLAAGGPENDDTVVVGPPEAGPSDNGPTGNARPTSFLAVREDGTLILSRDGDATVVTSHGDPREKPAEGTPQFIADVAWDDAQAVAYYESCCEPASGTILSNVVETGTEERVADGYHPAVGARRLAFSTYTGVSIIDLDTGERHDIAGHEGYEPGSGVVTISPDATTIALEDPSGPERQSRILVIDAGAASLDEARALDPPDGHSWSMPVFRGDGMLLVAQQCCWPEPEGDAVGLVLDPATGRQVDRFEYEAPVLDQAYDDTGRWLVYVTSDNVLRWRGGSETGTLGEGYRNADW